MSESIKKIDLEEEEVSKTKEEFADEGDWVNEFEMEDIKHAPISSANLLIDSEEVLTLNQENSLKFLSETESTGEEIDDPIFKELATPTLPEIQKENRARLLMQSPTRIQFYWSIKHNPFKTLNRAFSGAENYRLVAKLLNQTNGREEVFPVDAEGSWWFNVDAASKYQAEVGFYAPNRPFVRVMFSNILETPRKSPSPRQASESEWAISAQKFADVLDYSGYSQDAFEVALAGDDFESSEAASQNAFSQFIGEEKLVFASFDGEEIRFALLAIASGYSIEDLRGQIGASLFEFLLENADKLIGENAFAALDEHFDISMEEIEVDDQEFFGDAVFGASLVHFPKFSTKKRISDKSLTPKNFGPLVGGKLSPISSFSVGLRN